MNSRPTQIEDHRDEDDEPEPHVELRGEVRDGYNDVDDGREDVEHEVGEEAVDGAGAAVHDAEDLARLAGQVPAEAEGVKVAEQTDLNLIIKKFKRDCKNRVNVNLTF